MTLTEYLQLMATEYFYVCKNQSVIEIGPNTGLHTQLIVAHTPLQLKCIEPDVTCSTYLKKISADIDVVVDDAVQLLTTPHLADVVSCCGVLYHLHSPLHLLELIVNNCNPKHIVLDCVVDYSDLRFQIEEDNKPGSRQIKNWKSAGFNLVAPYDIINIAMKNMGYTLLKYNHINCSEYYGKHNVWAGLWEKTDENK